VQHDTCGKIVETHRSNHQSGFYGGKSMRKHGRKCTILAVFFSLLLFTTSTLFSAEIQIPRISIDELKQFMESGADIVIIDTQHEKLYERGHIKGALSYPAIMGIDQASTQHLPKDKTIIIYCDCGPGEDDSNEMALQLKRLGFKDVKVLADPSIRGWMEKGYPIEK
jgi:rhodanese-related sulfurtransferase